MHLPLPLLKWISPFEQICIMPVPLLKRHCPWRSWKWFRHALPWCYKSALCMYPSGKENAPTPPESDFDMLPWCYKSALCMYPCWNADTPTAPEMEFPISANLREASTPPEMQFPLLLLKCISKCTSLIHHIWICLYASWKGNTPAAPEMDFLSQKLCVLE